MRKFYSIFILFSALLSCHKADNQPYNESLATLSTNFPSPPDRYKPQAYWFWLGSNFSKYGITHDLEAMHDEGIGGVVIFNAPSWLDTLHNPWPDQTYRSPKYWDALGFALSEARRLGMKVGIHNAPGWSVAGGPWIKPEMGMKAVAYSKNIVKTDGNTKKITLLNPKANTPAEQYFKDVAVVAAPLGKTETSDSDLIDISDKMNADGIVEWTPPAGEWAVYRIGYYPTFRHTHPTPEDVQETSLEVDKMDKAAAEYHWKNVIQPYTERFKEYIGNTFYHLWIDSYEAGEQNWSPTFRADFQRIKNYDPVPMLILADLKGVNIFNRDSTGIRLREENQDSVIRQFTADYIEVTRQLFVEGFAVGKKMVNEAGFKLTWEPYSSVGNTPFDLTAAVAVPDIPATEFWVHSREPAGGEEFTKAAADKQIVCAEAFTGMEATCRFNETPAMLKRPADMAFSYGVNQFFVHAWAHNPLDDRFKPGFTFAHYGTHFTRHQTWFEPGKEFFKYIARCQMLLQQGRFVSRTDNILHRSTQEAEIFFVRNTGPAGKQTLTFPAATAFAPELWDARQGKIFTASNWNPNGDSTTVTLNLETNESVFVIFPNKMTKYDKQKIYETTELSADTLTAQWKVLFSPATDEPSFDRTFNTLTDWSLSPDSAIKYFSGTALYQTTFTRSPSTLHPSPDFRFILDLGSVYDLAEVSVNGRSCGVLWIPPFRVDITEYLKEGENALSVAVTNTWVNRLIGDEQYPEDFDWEVREQNGQRAMKSLPAWLFDGSTRPVRQRKTVTPWYFYDRDARLLPAGLVGAVRICKMECVD